MSSEGLLASARQRGNPILRCVRRVKVDFPDNFVELENFDFIVNSQLRIPVLFLSLKFHSSFKEYIGSRIEHVVGLPSASSGGQPPVLLVLVDVEDAGTVESHLEEVTTSAVLHGVRLLLAWSPDEAARILEILHVFGPDRAGDIARGVISTASGGSDQLTAQAKEAIQTIQGGVGQKDASNLLSNFKSVKSIILASKDDLAVCPSIGAKKSNHLYSVFNASWWFPRIFSSQYIFRRISMSFTVMTPQHSVERAYVEWVIKAIEVILQSRMKPGMIPNLIVRPSRQFALVFPEARDVRSKILTDPVSFFRDRSRIFVELLVNESVAERWIFSFDSPMDLLPTTRSERRDVSLPRRLTVCLRSLLSLTSLMDPLCSDENSDISFALSEQKEEAVLPPRTPGALIPMDFCCIPSSFGNLNLRVLCKDRFNSLSPRLSPVSQSTPVTRPASPPMQPIRLDEAFIQTHSLGGIEMVIEVDDKPSYVSEKPIARVSSVVSIAKSPLRDLTEIWPTSNLSYSSSPRDRAPSFASSSGDEEAIGPCISAIPGWPEDADDNRENSLFVEAEKVHSMYEKPIHVSTIIEFIDQFQQIR